MSNFYFTFGCGQKYQNCYVIIEAKDWNSARDEMVRRYGTNWSMQYAEDEWFIKYGEISYLGKINLLETGNTYSPDDLVSQAEIYNLKKL